MNRLTLSIVLCYFIHCNSQPIKHSNKQTIPETCEPKKTFTPVVPKGENNYIQKYVIVSWCLYPDSPHPDYNDTFYVRVSTRSNGKRRLYAIQNHTKCICEGGEKETVNAGEPGKKFIKESSNEEEDRRVMNELKDLCSTNVSYVCQHWLGLNVRRSTLDGKYHKGPWVELKMCLPCAPKCKETNNTTTIYVWEKSGGPERQLKIAKHERCTVILGQEKLT